ncbi:zinc finger protein chinmo-like isoform X9 [Macrobrachium rosenbergii]|uniref:zinc finger protein chinmo-like isoform X9 n=1 Tax=Macrobrachium rosenbergii TaxID=79674 RepID=UPI0034D4E424
MGSEQHYSLRWNDYTVKIVTAFQSLRDEEDFVDVTVACDGHSYSAHKMVLSACSPYFRALLRANPCQHPIVILKDVGHVELERLLEFMYNGEVSIAQDQLAAFLRTAENLKIRGLAGSSDDMDQLGLQRPDVSYSYSSCSIGGAGGTSGRSSPSAGYAPSQGSKDEEVGGDGSGGYHARAESPPSKRRKRLSAPAAGHADLNTETHSSDNSEMSGRYRCQHILTSDLYYEGRVMVLGRAPLDPIKVSADTGPAKRTYGETSLDDECVVEATVEIESGGSLSGTLPGEDDVRQDRRELKSEPGDVMAEVYSETSELTDPTSHSGEGLDPRQSVLYPLALPGPSGAAGNQDSVGPHESGGGGDDGVGGCRVKQELGVKQEIGEEQWWGDPGNHAGGGGGDNGDAGRHHHLRHPPSSPSVTSTPPTTPPLDITITSVEERLSEGRGRGRGVGGRIVGGRSSALPFDPALLAPLSHLETLAQSAFVREAELVMDAGEVTLRQNASLRNNDRPWFCCPQCGKGFRTRVTLSRHEKIHTGKAFPCPMCPKVFYQVSNVKYHVHAVHGKSSGSSSSSGSWPEAAPPPAR